MKRKKDETKGKEKNEMPKMRSERSEFSLLDKYKRLRDGNAPLFQMRGGVRIRYRKNV